MEHKSGFTFKRMKDQMIEALLDDGIKDENDDYYCSNLINNIVDQLGLTTRRFSKYCNGIELFFN